MFEPPASTVTVVLTGVSGSGKSTVATRLVAVTGWAFAEGDDLHPARNRARMSAGHPLTDAERAPWLARLASWVGAQEAAGRDGVLTCSALRRSYRDVLRLGHPSVWFAQLDVAPAALDRRLRARTGHFMPAALLASQLATLEPLGPDEPGTVVAAGGDPDETVEAVLSALRRSGR